MEERQAIDKFESVFRGNEVSIIVALYQIFYSAKQSTLGPTTYQGQELRYLVVEFNLHLPVSKVTGKQVY